MQKKLFTALLLATTLFSFAQEPCAFGTGSDVSGVGENASTGGDYEYAGAADFDVPFGTVFTTTQITVNFLKGPANLQYVNLSFREASEGLPGDLIQSFDNLMPTSQTLAYDMDDPYLDAYQITIDLPSEVVLQKGKYFLQLAAAAGDEGGAWWEITAQEQRYGVFDYSRFADEDWSGTGYYNKVFQIVGSCVDSGEVMPDYGNPCAQEILSNGYENGTPFISNGAVVSVADDFVVAPNTTLHLTSFTMHTLLLGGGMHNATVNIRHSADGLPGDIIQSFTNKGPAYEEYGGYWPFPGLPFDVVSVLVNFSFAEAPVELQEGTYFVEVIPTPHASEFITWESTSLEGIGSDSYTSYDGGASWAVNEGTNQVFEIGGFCSETLGTTSPELASGLKYFPNPVQDSLTLTSEKAIGTVSVYTIEGREVKGFHVNGEKVNMQALASGVYLVKVVLENGSSETFKIVKE